MAFYWFMERKYFYCENNSCGILQRVSEVNCFTDPDLGGVSWVIALQKIGYVRHLQTKTEVV